jgi:hypothetical protein
MATYGDVVAITNSATADAESAASTVECQAGAEIYEIVVESLTVGNTYAVRIDGAGVSTPQKYVVASNGAPANTNGSKVTGGYATIKCKIRIPGTNFKVTTFADVASATCKVGIKWSGPN